MCEFCEALKNRNKKIIWNLRSTYADDNVCEFVNGNECSACAKCDMHFDLTGYYDNDGDIRVGVGYNQEITSSKGDNVIIRPFSEPIQFNYCPVCGQQISSNLLNFDKYKYILSIVDNK